MSRVWSALTILWLLGVIVGSLLGDDFGLPIACRVFDILRPTKDAFLHIGLGVNLLVVWILMQLDTICFNLWWKVLSLLLTDSSCIVILGVRVLPDVLLTHHVDSLSCTLAYSNLSFMSLVVDRTRCTWFTYHLLLLLLLLLVISLYLVRGVVSTWLSILSHLRDPSLLIFSIICIILSAHILVRFLTKLPSVVRWATHLLLLLWFNYLLLWLNEIFLFYFVLFIIRYL